MYLSEITIDIHDGDMLALFVGGAEEADVLGDELLVERGDEDRPGGGEYSGSYSTAVACGRNTFHDSLDVWALLSITSGGVSEGNRAWRAGRNGSSRGAWQFA
jgi:hypothetical protein